MELLINFVKNYTTMKNIFLFTFISLLMFSCEVPGKSEKPVPEKDAERSPGFLRTADSQINADDANPENLDLWDKYIEAHNNRDLDAIASMNIDSTQQMGVFKIIGPDGSLTKTGHHIRLYVATEFKYMLEKAGLSMQNVYGGYDESPFNISGKRMIVIARKD